MGIYPPPSGQIPWSMMPWGSFQAALRKAMSRLRRMSRPHSRAHLAMRAPADHGYCKLSQWDNHHQEAGPAGRLDGMRHNFFICFSMFFQSVLWSCITCSWKTGNPQFLQEIGLYHFQNWLQGKSAGNPIPLRFHTILYLGSRTMVSWKSLEGENGTISICALRQWPQLRASHHVGGFQGMSCNGQLHRLQS